MRCRILAWAGAMLAGLGALSAAAPAGSWEVAAEALAGPAALAVAAPVRSAIPGESEPLVVDDLYADFPEDLDAEFESDLDAVESEDPMEGVNRSTFAFNRFLDRWAFDPITKVYQFIVPSALRKGVHNFFLNLETPVVMTNQLLQLRGADATRTFGRFLVNSTAGAGGLFDAAGRGVGWMRTEADFGQTLATWGTPSGAYLVVPILGPSTVRDFGGDIVDRLLDPLTYVIGPLTWWVPLGVGQGLSVREAHGAELAQLENSSVDFYAALRSAYLQSRAAQIRLAADGEDESATLAVEVLPVSEPES